jgi:hypothetical protein
LDCIIAAILLLSPFEMDGWTHYPKIIEVHITLK